MSHLESNGLLSKHQHGFRANLSTETALLQVTEQLYKNIDERRISLLVLLDLSKAFDSVNHNILIQKLNNLNIDSQWFKSYLEDRSQSVRINNTISSSQRISFGVPQGSILGHLLFLIYVNDMPQFVKNCFLIQYADDTQLVFSSKLENLHELIEYAENTLLLAKSYFQNNGLLLNEDKTQCIFIGSRQYISRIPDDIKINFNGNLITPSKTVKNLGVHFDRYLLFDTHIDALSKKVTGTLLYINRIKNHFSAYTRTMVIQSLVLSLINYCSKVWGMTSKQQIERVQKLQNFAAKVAEGNARKFDHVTPIINKLDWLKVDEQIKFDVGLTVYKTVHNQYPDWLIPLKSRNQAGFRSTRQYSELLVNRTSTDIGKNKLSITGPTVWNSLPQSIRDCNSIPSFKKALKRHIINNRPNT